jgi:hypothetical protein
MVRYTLRIWGWDEDGFASSKITNLNQEEMHEILDNLPSWVKDYKWEVEE